MSHFDAPSIGNAISEGIQFVTHKAGGDASDAEIAAWWQGVRDHRDRLLLGAYWVLSPGNATAKADAFLSRLDATCPGWRDGPFLLQLDAEEWNQDPATKPSVSDCNAFCDRLAGRASKLIPVGYLPPWAYGNSVAAFRYPLWASRYVRGSGGFRALYPGDNSSLWDTYGGKAPAILQYTSSATIGGQTTCDANAYRGTIDELTALVAPGWIDMAVQLNSDDINAVAAATVAALTKPTPLTGADGQPDGTSASPVGRAVWGQGLPPRTGAPRVVAWQALGQVGDALAALSSAPSTTDPAAVASELIKAGIGLDVARALVAQLSPGTV